LNKNLEAFLNEKDKPLEAEVQEFQKATNHGANAKKVAELAKAIRKRLDAIPPQTEPASDLPATPSPTATAKAL